MPVANSEVKPEPPQQDARPRGTQIDVDQRVGGDVSGEVTGVKVGTVQGDVTFQGPVTVTVPGLAAELASRLAPDAMPPSEDLRRPIIDTKPFEPETVYVPPGPFLMGADPGEGIPDIRDASAHGDAASLPHRSLPDDEPAIRGVHPPGEGAGRAQGRRLVPARAAGRPAGPPRDGRELGRRRCLLPLAQQPERAPLPAAQRGGVGESGARPFDRLRARPSLSVG